MTMEEASGPPGQKILRLLSFIGAGFICTVAINKWRELEMKSTQQQQRQQQQVPGNQELSHQNVLSQNPSNAVQKVVK